MTRISVTVSMRRGGADGRVSASGAERCLGTGRPRSPDPPPCRASDASAGAGGTTGDTGGGCGAGGVAPTPETFMAVLLVDGPAGAAGLDPPVDSPGITLSGRTGEPRTARRHGRPDPVVHPTPRTNILEGRPARDLRGGGAALSAQDLQHELDAEQAYVATLYEHLDVLRARARAALDEVRRAPVVPTPSGRAERDAFDAWHSERLSRLSSVEDRLAFGRLDLADGGRRYVGRLGLSDDAQQQLLLDWRAPAASAFYQATAAAPQGVARRRHLATKGRAVVGIDDELLDADALERNGLHVVAGEGALMSALTAHRTGRMRDIVATLQAEQDAVVRSPLAGVLVVQGGPGTGKTAVALHRAAYL